MRLLYLVCLVRLSTAYFEVSIIRNSVEAQFNLKEKINDAKLAAVSCSQSLGIKKFNSTVSTQTCFTKNLFFNVRLMVGDFTFNYEVVDLNLDLTVPWSWIKSQDCKLCSSRDPTAQYYKNIKAFSCNESCSANPLHSQSFILTNKKQQEMKKSAFIVSNETSLGGRYLNERLSFLVYNPEKKLTFKELIKQEFEPHNFENLEDIMVFKNFRLLIVEKMIGKSEYQADGALGFGFQPTDDELIEDGTNFMEKLLESEDGTDEPEQEKKPSTSKIIEDKRIFGLYINKIGVYFSDYALTLGGINTKYLHKTSKLEEINYVPLSRSDTYYWMVGLKKLRFHISNLTLSEESKDEEDSSDLAYNEIDLGDLEGIVTLNTKNIALPYQQLKRLIKIIESYGNANCRIVDKRFYQVYCENLNVQHILALEIEITFSSETSKPLKMNGETILSQCEIDKEIELTTQTFECPLNIQLSKSNYVILGEPFLKLHYTIFDQENQKIGFLPAADDTFWGEEYYYDESGFHWFTRLVLIVFVIGMMVIFCMKNIIDGILKIRQKYLVWKHKAEFSEVQVLNSQANSSSMDNSYADLQIKMKEKALQELDMMYQNKNSEGQVSTTFQNEQNMEVSYEEAMNKMKQELNREKEAYAQKQSQSLDDFQEIE